MADSSQGEIAALCGLLSATLLIANRAYRERVWGGWWVEPYRETCVSIYNESNIEEFAAGGAERLGFDSVQVAALNEYLHAMDRLTAVYEPATASKEAAVESEEWKEAAAKAKALLIATKSWSDRFCVSEIDRVPQE